MKTRVFAVVISGLLYASSVTARENAVEANQISLFKVSLRCPAAPGIGCGSHAKPILLELERDSSVSEAWLNRTGTTIAVVWKPQSSADARRGVVAKLKESNASEIQGKFRDEDLTDFASGKGWYRGAAVDRLSEEEAGIIAARLVRRLQAKIPLSQGKAERLERTLADAFRKLFTGDNHDKGISVRQLAGDFLDEKQIATLKEAIEAGVRPLPNEK